jgi:hypothetical protein
VSSNVDGGNMRGGGGLLGRLSGTGSGVRRRLEMAKRVGVEVTTMLRSRGASAAAVEVAAADGVCSLEVVAVSLLSGGSVNLLEYFFSFFNEPSQQLRVDDGLLGLSY